jgi:translation elongation factor EF-4
VEVFRQRLQDEFEIDAVVTPPKVPYKVTYFPTKKSNSEEVYSKIVEDLSEWPEVGHKVTIEEPIVDAKIIARVEDAGSVMELVNRKRGFDLNTSPIDEEKWLFTVKLPWAEVVTDFHDQLKTVTAGYGSLDTSESDPPVKEANVCKVDISLNGDSVGPLAFVCHRDVAQSQARVVCQKVSSNVFIASHNLSCISCLSVRFILSTVVASRSVTEATIRHHHPGESRR